MKTRDYDAAETSAVASFVSSVGVTRRFLKSFLAATLLLLFHQALFPLWAQEEIPDPPMPPKIGFPMGQWLLNDPTNWLSVRGDAPLSSYGVEPVESWLGSAVRSAGAGPAWLQYNYIEPTNSYKNISCSAGSLWLWYRPLWSSPSLGGSGPGNYAPLIEMGAWDSASEVFSLYIDGSGEHLIFHGQTNGGPAADFLTAELPAWASNDFHLIVLNWTKTNSALFLDGAYYTSGSGALYYPSASMLSNGLFIGSSASLTNLGQGDFQYVRAYTWPVPDNWIAYHYWSVTNQDQSWFANGSSMLTVGTGSTSQPDGATSLLSLGIAFDPPTGFLLNVFNMTPSAYYGIGAKDSVDSEPYHTWTLASVFQAQAANEQLSGTVSGSTRFFSAVNLDEYVGPAVSIVSPAPETTVSGDVALEVAVTDILPLLTINVYVGEVQVGVIKSGQNGKMTLPTSWFPSFQTASIKSGSRL